MLYPVEVPDIGRDWEDYKTSSYISRYFQYCHEWCMGVLPPTTASSVEPDLEHHCLVWQTKPQVSAYRRGQTRARAARQATQGHCLVSITGTELPTNGLYSHQMLLLETRYFLLIWSPDSPTPVGIWFVYRRPIELVTKCSINSVMSFIDVYSSQLICSRSLSHIDLHFLF